MHGRLHPATGMSNTSQSYITEDDDFESEEYGSEDEGSDEAPARGSDAPPLIRGKTKRDKKRKRHRIAAQAEWAKMPTTWNQVDLESDKKFFNLVEGEAEENRII